MARHTLPLGKAWIENLTRLGKALGYRVEEEFDVAQPGQEPAPVDLAWLRSAQDRFPLFIIEVETRPSGQMTYNAAKVFSQDTDLFEKPLFLFHLVLAGGQTSGRLQTATSMFGQFNYRVYRAVSPQVATRALRDVLSQHRRVAETLDVIALAGALDASSWSAIDLDSVWEHVERCGFRGSFEQAYAKLSRHDHTYRSRLARRLRRELKGRQIDSSQYETVLGQNCAPLLHAAILALVDPSVSDECLAHAVAWQETGAGARIAPSLQRTELHNDLAFAYAPALWACLAAAIRTEPARSFALAQLELTLGAAERPAPLAASACAAIWMLHLARSGGVAHRPAYERAAQHLRSHGGVPAKLLNSPPGLGALMSELHAWEARLQREPLPPPAWDEMPALSPPPDAREQLLAILMGALVDLAARLQGEIIRDALWT